MIKMLEIEEKQIVYSFKLDDVTEIIQFYNELQKQLSIGYTIDSITKTSDYTNALNVTYIHESRKSISRLGEASRKTDFTKGTSGPPPPPMIRTIKEGKISYR